MPTPIDYATHQLGQPLDRKHVLQRQQSGRSLSYIEGWHAIAEANRIFGFDGWTRETVDIRCVAEKPRKIGRDGRDGYGVSYIAKVRVTALGVVREGTGTGHGIDADLGVAHESAIKEAETDAMKRALMTFGNPFGLALYDKTQANVADEPPPERKSSYAIKKDSPEAWPTFEKAIRAATTTAELDAAWKQYSKAMLAWPKSWQEQADELFVSQLDVIGSPAEAAE